VTPECEPPPALAASAPCAPAWGDGSTELEPGSLALEHAHARMQITSAARRPRWGTGVERHLSLATSCIPSPHPRPDAGGSANRVGTQFVTNLGARAGGERPPSDSHASTGRHGRISKSARPREDASDHSAFGAPASAAAAAGGASPEGSSVLSAGVSGDGVELPQARTNADRTTLTTVFKLLMTKYYSPCDAILMARRCSG
jgi:hypothetical protein